MAVSTESIRRGLRSVEERLKITLSSALVEWLRQIYAEERARPAWLWPADEWQDLPAYLGRIRREWRPGARGIVVGHDGAEAWLVACDEERRLADQATRIAEHELTTRVERNDAPEPSLPAPVPNEWVSHVKFGVGRIIEHPGPDRVRVNFADGVRTLLKAKLVPASAPPDPLEKPANRSEAERRSPAPTTNLLFRRYSTGQHLAVYEELCHERATDDVAFWVAREMMQRVRHDIGILAERWRRLGGFELREPFGPTDSTRKALDTLEQRVKLPLTLRAFYLEIGFIDFVEAPRHADWPSEVEIDALEVLAPPSLDALESDDDCIVFPVFNDNVNKAGYAGVGPVMASLASDGSPAFDCELCFEGGSVGQLAPYLREAILVGGGIGGTGLEHVSDRLLRELTADLLPF